MTSKAGISKEAEWFNVIRWGFCIIAALLNGVSLALQGNAWIWIGFGVGLFVGFAWSAFLLFGISLVVQYLPQSMRAALRGASWIAAFILLVIICFQIWGPK